LCQNLNIGGYTDWYLPSLDELSKLKINQAKIGGFAAAYYWSSTEYSYNGAWGVNFPSGSEGVLGTSYNGYVRAIRSF
jgi:hypothetical protein